MVSIDPKEAAKSMTTILDDLAEVETLYEYKSPSEIIVSNSWKHWFDCRTSSITLLRAKSLRLPTYDPC